MRHCCALCIDGETEWGINLSDLAGLGFPVTVYETMAGGYFVGGVTAAGRGIASNLVTTDSQGGASGHCC